MGTPVCQVGQVPWARQSRAVAIELGRQPCPAHRTLTANCLAGSGGLDVGGGLGAVSAPGQQTADPAGRQTPDQMRGADGDQRQQAPMPGQPVAFLDGNVDAHGVSSPAMRRWSIRAVTSATAQRCGPR